MNLLELAQKRCSIRKYASSPVEDEKLAYILEAGRMRSEEHTSELRHKVQSRMPSSA